MPDTHIRIKSRSSSKTKSKSKKYQKEDDHPDQVEALLSDTTPLCTIADYEKFRDHPTCSVNRFTVTAKHTPGWLCDGSFIVHGYRRLTNSWAGCLLSLSYLHNESGNVYTHLLGALYMFQLMYYSYYDLIHDTISASILDILAIGTFFIGAIVCLALSTVFHLCCCHSRGVALKLNKADYVGIVFLEVGSFIPVLYYGFFCDPFYQILYCASIFTLGGLTMYVTLGHKFATAQYRWLRTGIFVLLGSVGIVPLVHHLARYGTEMAMESISTNYILVMASCYLLGAFIYGYRIPERWYPETFDIFGHSHQIWHCLVVLGAAIHFMGIYRMSIWWHEHNPMCGVSDEVMVSWFI